MTPWPWAGDAVCKASAPWALSGGIAGHRKTGDRFNGFFDLDKKTPGTRCGEPAIGCISSRLPWRSGEFIAAVRGLQGFPSARPLRIALFFTLEPWFDEAFGALRTAGHGTFHLDQVWPGVTDHAVVSLLIYLVAFDLSPIGRIAASTSWGGGGACIRCTMRSGK